MWTRLNKNLFILDFNQFTNITSKSKTNINDDLISYDVTHYNMIDNLNDTAITYHGRNNDSEVAITVFDSYLDIFVLNSNKEKNYSIKLTNQNEYKIYKEESFDKKF